MPFPDPPDDEPEWKRAGLAVEFWILTAITGGALVYGLFLALSALF